jgi:hypothetical protein
MVPTPSPMPTEGIPDYPFPTTIPYTSSNYPPTAAAAASMKNHRFRSTHHPLAHQAEEGQISTDRDLLPPREPGARADRRAGDLRSWTSVITPERKHTTSDRAPLEGSFNADRSQEAEAGRHPRPHSHSVSSEAGEGWRHHRPLEGLAPDLPRARAGLPGLNSMPSLVDRPDLELPLGGTGTGMGMGMGMGTGMGVGMGVGMGMGVGVDPRSLRCGLMSQEYPLLRMPMEEAEELELELELEERKMGTEMRMLTEMPMGMPEGGSEGYGGVGNAGVGAGAGAGVNGYGGGGMEMEMYWHPTSSSLLPIKVESPPP